MDKDVYEIINNVEKKLNKSVFYKEYNIYFLIKIEMYEVLIQDFLFFKFYYESLKKYDQIVIYISKNFSLHSQFIFSNEILKLPRLKFIKKNCKTAYDFNKFDFRRIENPIKIFIKKLFSYKNFVIGKKKNNIFIQNQPKILNLIALLKRDFFTDYLFRDFKNIINLKKGYLFFHGNSKFYSKTEQIKIGRF